MRSAYESVAWETMTSKSVSLSKIWLLLQVLPPDTSGVRVIESAAITNLYHIEFLSKSEE